MLTLNRKQLLAVALVGLNAAAISLPMLASADQQTTNTTVGLTVSPVLISYSSGPTVTLGTITPTSGGLQSTNNDTVSANTNDAAGLTVSLQEAGGSTAMTSGGNNIPTTSGTTTSPIALLADTWGWRVDSLTAGFGAGPTSTISNAAPSALKFAAIPANGSPFTIKSTSASGSTSASVWYSAMIDTSQATGAYSTTVTYTFTTN